MDRNEQQNIERQNLVSEMIESDNNTANCDPEILNTMTHKEHKKGVKRVALASMILKIPSLVCCLLCGVQIFLMTDVLPPGPILYFGSLLRCIYLVASVVLFAALLICCIVDKQLYNGEWTNTNPGCILRWQRLCKIKMFSFTCIVITSTVTNLLCPFLNIRMDIMSFTSLSVAIMLCASLLFHNSFRVQLSDIYKDCVIKCGMSDAWGHQYFNESITSTGESAVPRTGK